MPRKDAHQLPPPPNATSRTTAIDGANKRLMKAKAFVATIRFLNKAMVFRHQIGNRRVKARFA